MFFKLKITNMLKSGWGLENWTGWGTDFFIAIGVFPVELLAYRFVMVCCKLTEIHVVLFAYFTHLSNLNISGTTADICKG